MQTFEIKGIWKMKGWVNIEANSIVEATMRAQELSSLAGKNHGGTMIPHSFEYEQIEFTQKFYSLPKEIQRDLLTWFNTHNPDQEELTQLYKLYEDGRFEAWDCLACGERCYSGRLGNG